jgi:NADPH2:quinone reductase
MKAIRVYQTGEPDVLRCEETPTPQPGADEVLVRIHAAGVNPVDTYIRAGRYPTPPLPYTPGTDGAGVVESVGRGVTGWKPGDRIYTAGSVTGTYAEFALCKARQIHRLPESVSFEQGAAINIPYATAWRSLFQKARAQAGETVLIHGASGGVGVAAIQIARAAGLRVIGTGGTPEGRALVSAQGAHAVLDHTAPDYLNALQQLTEGRGPDVILEMLANVNLAKDLGAIARNGRIVIIGNRGTIEINPRDAMAREATVLGVLLFAATEPELVTIHAALGAGLENGALKPVVGKRFPLAQAAQAHVSVLAPGAYGKIVLQP